MSTNTWDETNPAGLRFRSLGDDDIRQFKSDIRERVGTEHLDSTGVAIDKDHFTDPRHNLSKIGLLGLMKGLRIEQRTYALSGNITIFGKLQIEINGDMTYLNSDVSLAFSGLAASTSYYIYVSSPGHQVQLGAGNFSYSSTVPTYSTSKKGWYNGTSRAIGFFRTSGTHMLSFIQSGSRYQYLDYSYLVISTITQTFTEMTAIANYVPVFVGTCAYFHLRLEVSSGTTTGLFLSVDGVQYSNTGYLRVAGSSAILDYDVELSCPLSSSRTIYAKKLNSVDIPTIYTIGFDLDGSL